jgi:anti-anti-sigma factor
MGLAMTLPDLVSSPAGLQYPSRIEGGYTVTALSGELDVACAPVLREQLLGELTPRASRLIVELSQVSFCDASGLAVLVGTGRRARLLGGMLRLAAPGLPVMAALRISRMFRHFDVFPTVSAATAACGMPGMSLTLASGPTSRAAACAGQALSTLEAGTPDGDRLCEAVASLLAHSDAWRDADPNRRFTGPLRALARAQADGDQAALTKAARSWLAALIRYPLNYSPAVAATATDLRHLIDASTSPPP